MARKGRSGRSGRRGRTMFGPARSSRLAQIVCLEDVECARRSARQLREEFKDAKTRSKKVHVKRATVLAANRAKVMSQNRNLRPSTRRQKARISRIYRNTARGMKLK